VSRASAYRVAADCVHVRIGRLIRVSESAFAAYVAQRTVEPRELLAEHAASDNMSWYRPTAERQLDFPTDDNYIAPS
jgi:hypothetical protein